MSAAAQLSIQPFDVSGIAPSSRLATVATIAAADVFALALSAGIAIAIKQIFDPRFELSNVLPALLAITAFPLIFIAFGLYPGLAVHPIVEFRNILKASGLTLMLVVCATFMLIHSVNYSRLFLFLVWALSLILVCSCRALVRRFCSRRSWWGIPTVVMGERQFADKMIAELHRRREFGLCPIALLSDSTSPAGLASHPSRVPVSHFSMASALAKATPGCYAVVALPKSYAGAPAQFIGEYTRGFSHVFVVPNLDGISSLWTSSKEIGGVLGIEVNQPLDQATQTRIKRTVDLALACVLIPLLGPLFAILYLTVLISSGRPVFYGHTRIGQGGKAFKAWKFRTMVPNAAEVLAEHLRRSEALQHEWATTHKLKCDPRITRVGRFLRRSSLDELPQIWNVFCAQMSFVGPRPIVTDEVSKYGPAYQQYLRVKPGITGLWQISGRNNTTYSERVRLDDYYVRNWSVSFDMYILYNSVRTVLCGEGAC